MAEWAGEAILASLEAAGAAETSWLATAAAFMVENATAINLVATAALADNARKRANRAARAAYEASLQDRKMMVRSSVEPRRIILGRQRVGGHVSYIASTGTNNDTLVMVLTLAGHEIDAVEGYWLNDTAVTLDGSGYVNEAPWRKTEIVSTSEVLTLVAGSGSITLAHAPVGDVFVTISGSPDNVYQATPSGSTVTVSGLAGYSGSVQVQYQYNLNRSVARILPHLGTSGQTVDTVLNGLLPADWSADHKGKGCAYLACVFTYDQDAFAHGLPVVNAQVRGAKVYDPRTSTTAWSQNPALLIRHYATSALGGNLSTSMIDDTMVQAAANVCDTSVTYVVGAVSETRALYTAGTVAGTDARPLDVVLELAEAMAGRVGWSQDKLRVMAGGYTAPVAALTEDHFSAAAPVEITPRMARETLFNIVNAQFADQAQDYRTADMPRVESTADIADDGAELPMELTFGAITHSGQAQQVGTVMLREARQALTVKARFKFAVYAVELFDAVTLTCSRYGWSAKEFLVVGRAWSLDGGIDLTLRETDSAIYDFGGTFDDNALADNTLLPAPWTVPQVTGVSVTSSVATLGDGTNQTRTKVSWSAVADSSVATSGAYEVQYTLAADAAPSSDWAAWEERGGNLEAIIPGLRAGKGYVFRVRARNGSGVRGKWSAHVSHLVANPPSPGAVTTDSATASSVTVSAVQHAPDGETWRTSIVSLTYTPTVDSVATLSYFARGTYATGVGGGPADLLHGVYISGSFDGFASSEFYDNYIGASASVTMSISGGRSFSLTGGVTYTFKVLAAKWQASDTVTVAEAELQMLSVEA